MTEPRTSIHLRPAFVVMAVFCILLFLAGPLAAAVIVIRYAPADVSLYLAPGMVGFVILMARAMSSSNQWVELDGDLSRARRLLTRRLVTHRVGDIVAVKPLRSDYMGPLENALMDAFLKTDNRGYELRFRDGSKLGLVRGDMAGLDDFLVALADRLRAVCPPGQTPGERPVG